MALKVVWAQPALDDLDDILSFIALDKPSAARALGKRVIAATRKLARFPSLGRRVSELAPSAYRELLIAPVRMLYRQDGRSLVIVHVTRQERSQ